MQPIGVVQAALTGDEVAIGTSLLAFVQYLGAAIFISGANSLFSNKLIAALRSLAPDIDAADVLKSGAAELMKVVPAGYEPQILLAYSKAITSTFASPARPYVEYVIANEFLVPCSCCRSSNVIHKYGNRIHQC